MHCGQTFPLHLWCRLLDQAELTLNMLCTSRINPNLSAHEQLHGIHNFNATPLAPPGTKCIAHEKSSECRTWAPHEQHGWYVGAAPKHYRCYQIYIPKTQGTRICDTVEFLPTHCKMPNVSAHDAAIYAANDLITALTKPQPTNSETCECSTNSTTRDHALPHQTPTNRQTQTKGGYGTPPPPPPPPPLDIQHNNKPRIVPIIANLRPQYPTKHEGLLEDPFPLIRAANSVTDPNTGHQLEYKQLINHPDSKLRQMWQCSSANKFG